MAKVSLRVYNHEIEGMIENGQLDEAVAHCQHILKTFPMYIETYRLLGKSFLEARRYADAADIFQRDLMAVPDDFVAHVGMSIIRDDEGRLDDAIWHMERAFEDQPSNPAIQGELRRLYGRRDGVEPSKIRLSRDALANMYSQGELFNQAIAEIRAVLAEDANRPDLQVMLARAYYRAGQKVEAAEMAATLLKKYAYCLDALRILVDVLPETARAENTQVYRQRLHMLDPYSNFVTGSSFITDQVADTAVTLEHLEYKSGAPISPQPNWASSLGIKLTDDKSAGPSPAWMATGDTAEQNPNSELETARSTINPIANDKIIPDWMRTAGWEDATEKEQDEQADIKENQPVEPLAQAEIPDWLKSMAPQELTHAHAGDESASAKPLSPDEGVDPDWLAGLGTTAGEAKLQSSQPAMESPSSDIFPDWLKELSDRDTAGTRTDITAGELEQPQPGKPPAPIFPSQAETEVPTVSAQSAQFSPALPDTISPIAPVSTPGDNLPTHETGEPKTSDIEEDPIAWLESLAAKQNAKDEGFQSRSENRVEDMPEWLRPEVEPPSAVDIPTQSPVPSESMPLESVSPPVEEIKAPDTDLPEEFPPVTFQEEGTSHPLKVDKDEMVLQESLEADQVSNLDELGIQSDERSGNPPDWMQKNASEPAAQKEAVSSDEYPLSTDEDITITTWLSKQDVEEALGKAEPSPSTPQPEAGPLDELPGWLKDLEKPSTPEDTQKVEEDLPDWLSKPAQPDDQGVSTAPVSAPGSEPEIPDWIDETIPVPEPPAPTTPGEWVPVDEKPVPEEELPAIPKPILPGDENPILPRFPRGTGMLSIIPPQDKDAELLSSAQSALGTNQLNEAMRAYLQLIKKNRLLDEVIQDLREAIYRFPVDPIVWQTLGDASMRANHLQDALDAYTKAEELLR